MDFSHQGRHCEYASCRQRDFLPFECHRCCEGETSKDGAAAPAVKYFCLAHRTREQHECPSLAVEEAARRLAPAPPAPRVSLPAKYRCHYPRCRVQEIISLHCRNCAHNFCIKHRFPTQHACESFGPGKLNRNTILPAGIMPPRPRDEGVAEKSAQVTAAAQLIAPSPVAFACEHPQMPVAVTAAVASLPLDASVAALSVADSDTAAASAVPAPSAGAELASSVAAPLSPSSPLLLHVSANSGSSCAAEMAQAGSHAATQDASTGSVSSASSASATAATVAAEAKPHMRHRNTNVSHLSKLLKQHS